MPVNSSLMMDFLPVFFIEFQQFILSDECKQVALEPGASFKKYLLKWSRCDGFRRKI